MLMLVYSALYMVLMEHFDSFSENVKVCMDAILTTSKTFGEPGAARSIGGSQIFGAISIVVFQFVSQLS